MCFSASASFGAGILLTGIGVATIKKTQHPSQLLFAAIPFIFGVQQISEGILWLTLSHPENVILQRVFTYVFLFFAQIMWPLWVPFSIMKLDRSGSRTRIQKALVFAGGVIGIYMAYCLVNFKVEAKIEGHHIKYIQDYPKSLRIYGIILYGLATVIPPFFSHIKRMWMLGATILISYIVTAVFYEHYILSVWCFFSSIISLSIFAVLQEIQNIERRKYNPQNLRFSNY